MHLNCRFTFRDQVRSPDSVRACVKAARKSGHRSCLRLLVGSLLLGVSSGFPQENQASGADLLFPQRCQLVLLSGLSGDIESENSYRQQIEGWLGLALQNSAVAKVWVLCDNPEGIRLPEGKEIAAIKAERENFLKLGAKLKAEQAPIVVVAWGHGGKQRSTPVLHVRGPRLTPDDFVTFCTNAGNAGSHWILLFRGSGGFGKALAGEGRKIITSEAQTVFGSDPVGMPLLLKLANPAGVSFDDLARQFGRAVAEWYEGRGLARTEEPSLWESDQKPILLAQNKVSPAAAGSAEDVPVFGEAESVKASKNSKQATETAGKETAATTPSSGPWKEIRKVEAEKYPEADGVVLSQRLKTTLGQNPAIVTEQEQFIQILKPEGKRFGDFDISYSPPEEEVEFEDCEVLLADGKLARLDPDKIAEAREQELGDYQAPHRKMFSLPGVGPGSVLHIKFRTQWRQFPLPRISLELPVGHELPAVSSVVQVSVPKDSPFHFAFERVTAPDPEVKSTSYSTTYRWALENVPAHQNESLTAPRQTPRLMVSTFPDWKAFAEWYGRISRMTDEVTPEIADKAKALTAGAKTDREKVIALYNYVTGLRYVALPLGINSVRPHAAANVLRNQYGDCKDKANLLNAFLKSVNVEAQLVLVPRFSQARPEVPGLAFNHAISRVSLGAEVLWLDTTDDICHFGLLPPGDSGRNVLPVDGKTWSLVSLPVPVAEDHRLQVSGEIAWSQDTDGAATEMRAAAFGYPDYELRASARDAREHRASLPLLAARFRPVNGCFALDSQTGTAASALNEPFTWQARGSWVGLATRSAQSTAVRAPLWLPREWDSALHRRHAPLFLNQGYPLTLDEDFKIALPPGSLEISLPRVCENGNGPLRWRMEWVKLGENKLGVRLGVQLQNGDLSPSESLLFQDQLRMLVSAAATQATITPSR